MTKAISQFCFFLILGTSCASTPTPCPSPPECLTVPPCPVCPTCPTPIKPPESRILDVDLRGSIRGEGGDLGAKYLRENWRVVKLSNLGFGDRIGVTIENDGLPHDCAVLDVIHSGPYTIRGTVGFGTQPTANPSTLNDYLSNGWKEVMHSEFGSPVIGDRYIYAVCKN